MEEKTNNIQAIAAIAFGILVLIAIAVEFIVNKRFAYWHLGTAGFAILLGVIMYTPKTDDIHQKAENRKY